MSAFGRLLARLCLPSEIGAFSHFVHSFCTHILCTLFVHTFSKHIRNQKDFRMELDSLKLEGRVHRVKCEKSLGFRVDVIFSCFQSSRASVG